MIAFGPIPSRRLGHSLGINHIPPKYCSYSCVYCQVGKAVKMDVLRKSFYAPEEILKQVKEKIAQARGKNEKIDYLSLVPDGEPCLDQNLGTIISLLKPLGFPVAVITNGTLLWDPVVRNELGLADWVSVKIDAYSPAIWKRIDRPYKSLNIEKIREGILLFRKSFRGTFNTETMLAKGYNDRIEELEKIASFVSKLNPHCAYLGVPTRPPAVKSVGPPDESFINSAFQIFQQAIPQIELLLGHEGDAFAFTGDAREDILSITAVHPIRQEALDILLQKAGAGMDLIQSLINEGLLIRTEYRGSVFYLRKLG